MFDDVVNIKLQVENATTAIAELKATQNAVADVKSTANNVVINPLKSGSLFTSEGKPPVIDWYQAELIEREKMVFERAEGAKVTFESLQETTKEVNRELSQSVPLLSDLGRALFGVRGAQAGRIASDMFGVEEGASIAGTLGRLGTVVAAAFVGFKAVQEQVQDFGSNWSEMIGHLKKNNPELAGHVKAVGDWFSSLGSTIWDGLKFAALPWLGAPNEAMKAYNQYQRAQDGAEKPNRRSDWENIYNRRFGNNWSG